MLVPIGFFFYLFPDASWNLLEVPDFIVFEKLPEVYRIEEQAAELPKDQGKTVVYFTQQPLWPYFFQDPTVEFNMANICRVSFTLAIFELWVSEGAPEKAAIFIYSATFSEYLVMLIFGWFKV